MAFCPKCKLEYVEGVKICPDCNENLVASLEEIASNDVINDINENADFDIDDVEEVLRPYVLSGMTVEEATEYLEHLKTIRSTVNYKSKESMLNEHKSGAPVLLFFGIVGVVVLLLNAFHVLNFPMRGFSLWLLNLVMGLLFVIFIFTGILSLIKIKKLNPLVLKEKEEINKAVEFLKINKAAGLYSIPGGNSFEEAYLKLSEQAVKDMENEFPDLEEGFAFYVVENFAGDILNED